MNSLLGVLLICLAFCAAILLLIFVLVPVFKGVGWLIGAFFKGLAWLIVHLFEFIGGMIGDTLRFIGSIIAMVFLVPFVLLNILIGRWSAAGHFAESVKRECKVGAICLYRVALRRPLKLLMLHGMLEGIEQRVPEAMAASPGADRPSRRTGQFEGYTIVGSLPGGGSGAKLYIAEPDDEKQQRDASVPDQVVIKSFTLSDGSSLPQIVRESRALEAAKQLRLVVEHGMDEHRFFYVMPYHAGEHLGIVTRQLHGETSGRGLDGAPMQRAMGYLIDLVNTLSVYHQGGLWHKDIKPENIIIHDGQAHIVDLGLVTPLRSAMTLTTHGTEYFRDPEMVRQALRGVKVHQVDGAKFDIYAAGAVLYFVIENTFPAHGGLSKFSRKSPESLRWIVRRSMAEYNQRYATADDMLGDLRFVAAAHDPYAVKPADLPSMRGQPFVEELEEPEAPAAVSPPAQVAHAAGTPMPPPIPVAPQSPPDEAPAPPWSGPSQAPAPQRRPRLRVTNWWTGAYEVDDPGTATDPDRAFHSELNDFREQARAAREAAQGLRQQEQDLRRQVNAGRITARRAAREQLKTARQRAKDLRNKVHERSRGRRHARTHANSIALTLIGAVTVLALFALAALVVTRSGSRSLALPSILGSHNGEHELALAEIIGFDGAPLLLYLDGADADDSDDVKKRLATIVRKQQQQGYHIVVDDGPVGDTIRQIFDVWTDDRNGEADHVLEEALEANNLYGVLHVTASSGGWLDDTVIFSERHGAKKRRYIQIPTPAMPYLLVNDHPAKADPEVEQLVESIVDEYESRGWQIVVMDEAEPEIRRFLPTNPLAEAPGEFPVLLRGALLRHDLGGVLRIGARPGEGSTLDRLVIRTIDATAIAAPDVEPIIIEAPAPPAPPDAS